MERQLISKWLEENGKTQVWLAEKTGIRQNHLSEFLSNKEKGLGWDNIVAICRETGIDLNALAGLKAIQQPVRLIPPDGVVPITRGFEKGKKVKILVHGYVDAEIVNGD